VTDASTPIIDPPPPGQATELPVVVLGGESGRVKPMVRLLPGRVYISVVLYPIYVLIVVAAIVAVNFALQTAEWSPSVVALAYGLFFCWNWVYGVAYRYRRWLLKFMALTASLFMGLSLTYLVWERAQAQLVPIDGRLVMRAAEASLDVVWFATLLSTILLLLHVLILGRGYREKRARVNGSEMAEKLTKLS
jgi:hypothetical protein